MDCNCQKHLSSSAVPSFPLPCTVWIRLKKYTKMVLKWISSTVCHCVEYRADCPRGHDSLDSFFLLVQLFKLQSTSVLAPSCILGMFRVFHSGNTNSRNRYWEYKILTENLKGCLWSGKEKLQRNIGIKSYLENGWKVRWDRPNPKERLVSWRMLCFA